LGEERIDEIQLLRGFAILAVIGIHSFSQSARIPDLNLLQGVSLWLDYFLAFAVPCFLVISGFVLSKKYSGKYCLKDYYIKRIRSTIPQYLIFSFLYFGYKVITYIKPKEISFSLFSGLAQDLLFGSSFIHLWFFIILFQFYLLFPFLLRIYEKYKSRFIVSSLILMVGWNAFILILKMTLPPNEYVIVNLLNKPIFLSMLFYFILGFYIRDHFQDIKRSFKRTNGMLLLFIISILISIISISFLIALNKDYMYSKIPYEYFIPTVLLSPIYIIMELMLIFKVVTMISKKMGKIHSSLRWIGDYSFGIFLIHPFMREIIVELYQKVNINYNDAIYYPTVWIGMIVLSCICVFFISKMPFSFYLIGIEPRISKTMKDR
jgi:peptidoglycan/LPS O-acetylase OafA/YrhL